MSLSSFREEGIFRGLYVGTGLSTGLYGANLVQCWTYFNNNHDRWPLRSVVSLLFALDTAVTYLEGQSLYDALLDMQKAPMTRVPLPDIFITLFTAITVFIVDLFFAARVYYFGRCHWTVVAFILIMAFVAGGVGLVAIIRLFIDDNMDILSTREATIEMSLVNVSSALSEITAALALCWSFRTIRTGVQRTDNVLQRLFVYSITRGILLTAHQILSLVLFAIQPTPGTLWVPFEMTLSKMYFATMLSLLNTRPALRNRLGLTVEITRTVDADSNVNVNVNGTNQGNRISLRSMAFRDPLGTNNLTTMGTSSTSDTESEYPPEFDLGEHPSHSLQKDGSEPKQTV